MIEPKILYFDIETTPLLVPVFRLGKQEVRYSQILKYPQVMCISWAWGDGRVQHDTFNLKKYDWYQKDNDADLDLLKRFSKVYAEADIVIGHNAKMFDIGTLKSRIIKHRLPPITPTLIDDSYLQTKDIGFVSHKLDSLSDYLGFEGKLEHGHDMEWWIAIMYQDEKILKRMVKYCDVDVKRLREVYKVLRPYIKSNLNLSTFNENGTICGSCGSSSLQKRGFHRTLVGKFQRYQCQNCGAWTTDGENLLKKSKQYKRPR